MVETSNQIVNSKHLNNLNIPHSCIQSIIQCSDYVIRFLVTKELVGWVFIQ